MKKRTEDQSNVSMGYEKKIQHNPAFLHGSACYHISMVEDEKRYACSVKTKVVFGLKQAPRAWYGKIDDHMQKKGFDKSTSESTLYIKVINDDLIIVSLYVNGLLVTKNNAEFVKQFKIQMMQAFEMTDLREMAFFLGIE